MRESVTWIIRKSARLVRPEWIRVLAIDAGLQTLRTPRLIDLPVGERLTVLAPHPDDESIGCGGLVARWRGAGRAAFVVFLSDGEDGDRALRSKTVAPEALRMARAALATRRRKEAHAALEFLGGSGASFLALPDGALMRNKIAVKAGILAHLKSWQPDVLALPFVGDRHPDHVAAAAAAAEALAMPNVPAPTTILAYELWSPLAANAVLDISEVTDRKRAAINSHRSQVDQHEYAEAALALNRYRALASLTGVEHAEAFWIGGPREFAALWAKARS